MPEAQSLPPMRPILAEIRLSLLRWSARWKISIVRAYCRSFSSEWKDWRNPYARQPPVCSQCRRVMVCQDVRPVSWLARVGRLRVGVPRYRCPGCKSECRPLPELPGVEPGRISGSLARELAVLAAVVPYPLAARLADLLLGVKISAMGIWKVSQRLGQAVADYSEGLSRYHADSRSAGANQFADRSGANIKFRIIRGGR